jgi:sigma-B regulation protein RsbQ
MTDVIKRNNVKILGTGTQPLLFAHGFIGDQTLWRWIAPAFTNDYRVILFDYVGSGNSDPSAYNSQRYSHLEGYAQDVIDICENLELREVIFVSHSVSGMIGLIASIQHPEYFAKMILIGPSPCYINDGDYVGGFEKQDLEKLFKKLETDYSGWAKELAPAVMNTPDKPELSQELINNLLTSDQKAVKLFGAATFFSDYRKDLLKIRIPSLIIQGSEDMMAPLQVGDYLHAHLDSSSLKVLKAKGHFLQLSAPRELIKVMRDYLLQ